MGSGSKFIDQILALVSDSLQVVSYKWLSRSFSISSNAAKRWTIYLKLLGETCIRGDLLLVKKIKQFGSQQDFVDKYGDSVEVVYAVSGWTKLEPRYYSIQLVPRSKLQQAWELLADPVNSQVYSVQPCIPKDPAELWTAEYIQAGELFNEPSDTNNCLRDNRFSAVSSSASSCSLVEKATSATTKNSSKISSSHVPAICKPSDLEFPDQQRSHDVSVQVIEDNQKTVELEEKSKGKISESFGPKVVGTDAVAGKVSATAGPTPKVATGVPGRKKVASGPGQTGSSLANLWSRAPARPKSSPVKAEKKLPGKEASPPAAGDAEARVRALEAICNASSDDDDDDDDAVDFARIRRGRINGNGRKRHVVFDDELSDVENQENVNLTSSEVPKPKVDTASKVNQRRPRVENERRAAEGKKKTIVTNDVKMFTPPIPTLTNMQEESGGKVSTDEVKSHIASSTVRKVDDSQFQGLEPKSGSVTASDMELTAGLKKRKVLKSYIDDRGREVTQVVWEVDDIESESKSEHTTKSPVITIPKEEFKLTLDRSGVSDSSKLSSSAQNPANKSSGKPPSKTSGKESQQGKIMSFFKKKN